MKKEYKEPVLDLKEFIWEVLSQWKAILLVALFLGLTLPFLKHFSAMKQYRAQLEAKNEVVTEYKSLEEQKDSILLTLSDSDRAAVINGLEQRASIINSSKYVQSSILMNMDLYNEKVINLGFSISADQDKSRELFYGYINAFDEQGLLSLGKALGYDTEPEYVSELLTIDSDTERHVDNYNTVSISIAVPREADVNTVKETVVQIMKDRCEKLTKTVSPNTVSLIYCDEAYKVDYDAISKRYDAVARMNSLQNNLKSAISTMSVEQSAAYNQIVGMISADIDMNKQSDDSNQEINPPGYSKKYAVVGFVMGAMLYIVLLLLYMLFSGSLFSGDSAAYYSDSRLIGSIYTFGIRKGFSKLCHSKIVDRIRFDGISLENQIDKTVASLAAINDHYKLERIPIIKLADNATVTENQIAEKIVDKAKSKDLNIEILEAMDSDGTINEEVIQAEDRVILVLMGDNIKNRKLKSLVELLNYYDVNTEGIVFVRDI